MSPRRKRLARIVELREKALNEEVAELGRAEANERLAEGAERRAKDEVILAEDRRRALQETGADVATFLEVTEWQSKTYYEADLARHRLAQARIVRGRAQLKVKAARTRVKQVEKVAGRLAENERLATLHAERKLEDELAGREFFYDKRGD
jgi:hypothetical protein